MVLEPLQVLAVETVAHRKADVTCIDDVVAFRDDPIQQALAVLDIGVEHIIHADTCTQVTVQETCREAQAHLGYGLYDGIILKKRGHVYSIAAQFHIVFWNEHIRKIEKASILPHRIAVIKGIAAVAMRVFCVGEDTEIQPLVEQPLGHIQIEIHLVPLAEIAVGVADDGAVGIQLRHLQHIIRNMHVRNGEIQPITIAILESDSII